MSDGAIPDVALNDGVEVPQLGFGVFLVPDEETERAVTTAFEAGYRHIDTASAYYNEEGVGAAIAASGLPREEIFLATKLWNPDQGYESTLRSCEESLERLGVDSLDLYLIHWPAPPQDLFVDTWRAFEKLKEEGKTRSIGVSNFRIEDLERLERETEQMPSINQVELHPLLQQKELREWHAAHGVATEAWSPLVRGAVLDNETIAGIAAAHGRTPAQVTLRWHLQLGNVVIVKSVRPDRVRENREIFDFELADEEMEAIAKLEDGTRIGPEPATFVMP